MQHMHCQFQAAHANRCIVVHGRCGKDHPFLYLGIFSHLQYLVLYVGWSVVISVSRNQRLDFALLGTWLSSCLVCPRNS